MIINQYLILDASCLMTHGSWLYSRIHGNPHEVLYTHRNPCAFFRIHGSLNEFLSIIGNLQAIQKPLESLWSVNTRESHEFLRIQQNHSHEFFRIHKNPGFLVLEYMGILWSPNSYEDIGIPMHALEFMGIPMNSWELLGIPMKS